MRASWTWGLSLEVAAEKGNERYLSHGEANPLAIVLSPEQRGPKTPIYYPYHSFEWKLMDEWYRVNRTQVTELTQESAVWLDIDQEVDIYARPTDLTMVFEVNVRARSPSGLIERAIEQRGLVGRFLTEDDSYLNLSLIGALEKSRREAGDLRQRSLVIRDLKFLDVRDFYSRAFGGVFLLRSKSSEPLIICRDGKVGRKYQLPVADVSVLETLAQSGYIERNMSWWQQNLYQLRIIAESFLMEVLDEVEPKMEFFSQNSARKKAVVKQYQDRLGTYLEFQRLIKALEGGKGKLDVPKACADLLYHPAEDLDLTAREVIGQLLTYIGGGRLVPLFYRYQKTEFVAMFTKIWKAPRRQWALMRVQEFYDLASKSSGVLP